MKVKVCPKCGKQNSESALNCIDCGTTLSMKTLIDTDELKASSIAGKVSLSNISSFFEQEVLEILKTVKDGFEDVIWGCNITQVTDKAPFRFGFLIITSLRFVSAYFESDIDIAHGVPLRAYFELSDLVRGAAFKSVLGPVLGAFAPKLLAVDSPQYPLSPKEKSSQVILDYKLTDLTSAVLSQKWYGEILLPDLNTKFQQGNELVLTFNLPADAEKAHNLLTNRK